MEILSNEYLGALRAHASRFTINLMNIIKVIIPDTIYGSQGALGPPKKFPSSTKLGKILNRLILVKTQIYSENIPNVYLSGPQPVSSVTILSITSKIFAPYARFHLQFYLVVTPPFQTYCISTFPHMLFFRVGVILERHENASSRNSFPFFLTFGRSFLLSWQTYFVRKRFYLVSQGILNG